MELDNLNNEINIETNLETNLEETKKNPQAEFENLIFEGKEYCSLNEDNILQLKPTKYTSVRNLGKLEMENPLEEITPYLQKFNELKQQFDELQQEWSSTEEKLKLSHKVYKLKDLLQHTNAIGNLEPLFEQIEEQQKHIDAVLEENYQQRLKIVTKAEALIAEPEVKDETEQEEIKAPLKTDFRELKEEWKNAPEIKKEHYNSLLKRMDTAETEYYNQKRKAYEDKEHEQMQNLDRKMEICEKAEKLTDSEHWKQTTDAYKELLEDWKKIGFAPSHEKNEELWNRFNTAKNAFFERKNEHSLRIRNEQEQNLILKTALVEKAETLKENTDWKNTTQAYADLMEEWKKVGKIPYEKSDEIWDRLQTAKNFFFNAKRESALAFKGELEENYQKKTELLEKAEALKNSKDWFDTTTNMNELMNEWKKIGPTPKAYGDELWEKFIGARKHFFNSKDEDREQRKSKFQHQINNRLHQTVQFFNKIEEELDNDERDLEEFKTALENTDGEGAKEQELKAHLEHLIKKIEQRIPAKRLKLEDVTKQKEELSAKCKEVNEKARTHSKSDENKD